MSRRAIELTEGDLEVLASALNSSRDALAAQLRTRPWTINDLVRAPQVVELALGADDGRIRRISPALYFIVVAFQAADALAETDHVADWVTPNIRLPVFDVEPLREFSDNENRLAFLAALLAGFATPTPPPVPAKAFDLVDLARWLDAVEEPTTRKQLLRRLGDLALFLAGVFPDASGAGSMSPGEAERLGHSAGLDEDQIWSLVDPEDPDVALSSLETLGAAWYVAAADVAPQPTASRILVDIATRMRPARRFLNHLADTYLDPRALGWSLAA